jgi:hypothetical protein
LREILNPRLIDTHCHFIPQLLTATTLRSGFRASRVPMSNIGVPAEETPAQRNFMLSIVQCKEKSQIEANAFHWIKLALRERCQWLRHPILCLRGSQSVLELAR